MGQAYEATGQKDAAADAWQHLMELPPSYQSHAHLADVHNAARRWKEAAAEWRSALELAPDSGKARAALTWALFRSRDYEAAIATLEPLLREKPGAETLFLQGASLLNLQKPKEALPFLRAATEADPKLLPARAALGQALLQTGKHEEAIPLLQQSVSVDEDGSTHFQLFRAYQLANRKAEAEEALAAYKRLRAAAAH